MRKISIAILITILFASCGNNSTKTNTASNSSLNTESVKSGTKSMKIHKYAIAPRTASDPGIVDIELQNQDPLPIGAFRVKEAIDNINKYKTSPKNASRLSFIVDAEALKTYLTTNNSTIVHFFIGDDAQGAPALYIAPNEYTGQHTYIKRNDSSFLLSMCPTHPNIPEKLDTSVPPKFVLKDHFIEAMSVIDAQKAIDDYKVYITSTAAKKTRNAFLYNALDLAQYIDLNEVKYVQFSLAIINNDVDLIIVGVDDTPNHLYFNYNGNSCVMENCHPCPTCMAIGGGTMLEKPNTTY